MLEILISMASWLAINLITRLAWKLNISKTYVSVLLCLVIWALIYAWQAIVDKYPLERQEIVAFASWAYATSQIIYNLYTKFVEKKLTKKSKKE